MIVNGELFDPYPPSHVRPSFVHPATRSRASTSETQRLPEMTGMDGGGDSYSPPESPANILPDGTVQQPALVEHRASAPVAKSPKKRRKTAVNLVVWGKEEAMYLDVARELISGCDSTHPSRTYCMPNVVKDGQHMAVVVCISRCCFSRVFAKLIFNCCSPYQRDYGVHVSLHKKSFVGFQHCYVMVCNCKQMRACCTEIVHDGDSANSDVSEWYQHAYWYEDGGGRIVAECIHIRALRIYLKWERPVLTTNEPLVWTEPRARVTLLCDVPVISVHVSSSESVLDSRTFVKRWGGKYLCQVCGRACEHVKAAREVDDDMLNEDENFVTFLPPDERHNTDMKLRRQIEAGFLLTETDGTLKDITQVTIPIQPRPDLLFNIAVGGLSRQTDLFAEDEDELCQIGGSCLCVCNVCGHPWSTTFAEPICKPFFTRAFSRTVRGM